MPAASASSQQFEKLEPFGMLILLSMIFLLPLAGFSGATRLIAQSSNVVVQAILRLTGNA